MTRRELLAIVPAAGIAVPSEELPARAPTVEVDRSTPIATVQSFLAAQERRDYYGIVQCIHKVDHQYAAKQFLYTTALKVPWKLQFDDFKCEIAGDNAIVRATMHMDHSPHVESSSHPEALDLIRSGDLWLIDPTSYVHRPNVQGLLHMMVTMYRLEVYQPDPADVTQCKANMRRLTMAVLMYVQDSDAVLPMSADNSDKQFMKYLGDSALFTCCQDPRGVTSYSFNRKIGGVPLYELGDFAKYVLFYEGAGGKLRFCHNGKACVGFISGHCEMVNAEEAESLNWHL